MTRSDRLHHLLTEHRTCLARAEESERTYSAVVAQHLARAAEVGRAPIIGEQRAANDARLRTAVGDGAFYRDKATMYGIAVLVELMAGGEPC